MNKDQWLMIWIGGALCYSTVYTRMCLEDGVAGRMGRLLLYSVLWPFTCLFELVYCYWWIIGLDPEYDEDEDDDEDDDDQDDDHGDSEPIQQA